MGQPEWFYMCCVNKEYKSPPPHYKLTLCLVLYVSNYLLQLLNLCWAQIKSVACSSSTLLFLFFSLVQLPINNMAAKYW